MPPPAISISAGTISEARHTPTTRRPMPIIAAAFSIPVLATALSIPATALVIEHPQSADAYAVLGAILASLISLIEARYNGRDLRPALTAFLASAAAGSFTPKPIFLILMQWGWLTAESPLVRAWEVWAAAGFIAGMNGWWIINRISALLKSFLSKDSAE